MTRLAAVLGIQPPALVALVGSGGKTSLMYALAAEAAAAGARVAAAVTTKIYVPDPDDAPCVILTGESPSWRDDLNAALDREGLAVLARERLPQPAGPDKLGGLDPGLVDGLLETADLVIVEADGARRRPLKAPGPNEPVVPPRTGLVVAMVGLSGLGRPLDEETVFRPEVFGRLAGMPPGAVITPDHAARVVHHPEGHFKNSPPAARRLVFLNQADAVSAEAARLSCRAFLDRDAGTACFCGSLRTGRLETCD